MKVLRSILIGILLATAFSASAQEVPVYETTDNDFQFRAGWPSQKVSLEK